MIRYCVICGKPFKCSPSDKIVTCSYECRCERARRAATGTGYKRKWSEEAKKKWSEKGQTDNLKKGTIAAQKSPIAGPFETHYNALTWVIMSPDGIKYKVRNLSLWLRDHADILPGTPEQAMAGFKEMKRSMEGKRPTVNQWKGWRLLDWWKD